MMYSTTHKIDGYETVKNIGLVTGEHVEGVSFVKDFFASITNTVGGKSNSYTKAIVDTKGKALKVLELIAEEVGADAVVGLSFDITNVQMNKGGMFMCNIVGTAVKIKKINP